MATSAVVRTIDVVIERLSPTGILPVGSDAWINQSKWPEPPGLKAEVAAGDTVRIGLDKAGYARWIIRLEDNDPWDQQAEAELEKPAPAAQTPDAVAASDASDMMRCSAVKAAGSIVEHMIDRGLLTSLEDAEAALESIATLARELMIA